MAIPKEQQTIYVFLFICEIIFMAALVPAVPTLSWGSDIDYEFSVSLGVSHAIPCFMGLLAFVFSGFIAFFLFKHPDLGLPPVAKMIAIGCQGVSLLFVFLCTWLVLWPGASIAVPWMTYFLCLIPAIISAFLTLGVMDFIKQVLSGNLAGGNQNQENKSNVAMENINSNNTSTAQNDTQQNYSNYGQNNSNFAQSSQPQAVQHSGNISNDNNLQQNLNNQPQQDYMDPYQKEPTL